VAIARPFFDDVFPVSRISASRATAARVRSIS
jgi:hypothetical protein